MLSSKSEMHNLKHFKSFMKEEDNRYKMLTS